MLRSCFKYIGVISLSAGLVCASAVGVAAAPADPAPVEAASVPNPRAEQPVTTLPEGDGKEFAQNSCGKQCHGIDRFTSYRLSRSGWQAIVGAMVARGATGSEEEMKLVVDYLTAHFGR